MIHSEDNDSKYVRADFPWFDVLEMRHYCDAQELMVHGGRTKLILRKAVQQLIVISLKYQFCIDRNSGKITFTPRLALPGEFNQRLVQGFIQKLRHLHFRLIFWSDGILYLSLCWMIIANCWCFNLNSIGLGLKSRRDHQIWIWMYITSGREPAERIKRNVRKIQKGPCW